MIQIILANQHFAHIQTLFILDKRKKLIKFDWYVQKTGINNISKFFRVFSRSRLDLAQ